jgi:purine-nucleoside phosphorylase
MTETIELTLDETGNPSVFSAGHFLRSRLSGTRNLGTPFPRYCLLGFDDSHYQRLKRRYPVHDTLTVRPGRPYLLFSVDGLPMAFVNCGVGAPAAVLVLEETVALGARACLFTGTCGALQEDMVHRELVLPTRAVRDEGTSFHYAPPSRYSSPHPELAAALRDTLRDSGFRFREAALWTTDAPYRETAEKIARLRSEGCAAVDMEGAALFSAGRFRNTPVAGLLAAQDSLATGGWRAGLSRRPDGTPSAGDILDLAMRTFLCWHDRQER